MSKRLWITWENHRRSKELASEFEADYYPLVYDANRPVRYFVLTFRTIHLLFREKPKIVFCQNPSIVLTALLTILKTIFRFKLIVDRHSNFKIEHKDSPLLKWKVFHLLSRWTIKKADLTIVTNEHLRKICNELGGSSEVLQDKIPDLKIDVDRQPPSFMKNREKTQVMFVTMFDDDEPIKEMVKTGPVLSNYILYFTGKYSKVYSYADLSGLSENIVFTGFIPDTEYLALMENSDLVVVLTKKDLILNCGAYEAISLSKPLILSDTPTLREYFDGCAWFANNNCLDISDKIKYASINSKQLVAIQSERKTKLQNEWRVSFDSIVLKVMRLVKE